MVAQNNSQVHGGSKRYSIADEVSIKAVKVDDEWGSFDEDWGFRIWDIPKEFRTQKKFENFKLAKQEEEQGKIILESMPYQIDVEPTNVCNLHCPLCSTGTDESTRKKGMLEFENFKKLIDQIKDFALQLSLQNWGESTLVKDFPKMIRYATDAGIFSRLSTNFSVNYTDEYFEEFLRTGLGRLVIDIDGTTQEVYEKYRIGGNLKTVVENTKKAMKMKREMGLKYPVIQARMLVNKFNEHQLDDFKQLAKDLEVDEMELGNIQLNPNTAAEKWLPKNKQYVYETYRGERRITPCHWPWSGLVINWDGGVAPCSIVDDPDSDFGNVFESDLKTLWNNEYYVSARSTWAKNSEKKKFTICNMCKNDTHNPNLLRVGDTFSLTLNKSLKDDEKFLADRN